MCPGGGVHRNPQPSRCMCRRLNALYHMSMGSSTHEVTRATGPGSEKHWHLLQVSYTLELDVYDFCSDELKATLDGPRSAYKLHLVSSLQRPRIKHGGGGVM